MDVIDTWVSLTLSLIPSKLSDTISLKVLTCINPPLFSVLTFPLSLKKELLFSKISALPVETPP